jgi:PAS domain S-box-containing protein
MLSFGQNGDLDSLFEIIEGDYPDSTRIKTQINLSLKLQSSDLTEAKKWAKDASFLAIETQNYSLAAQAHNQMGLLDYYSGDFDNSKENFKSSGFYYEKAEEPLGVANALNNAGVINYEQGYFYNALTGYLEALFIRKSLNDSASIAVSYNNIGNVQKDLKQFDKAIDYYNKSIELKILLKDPYGLAMTYNNIGLVYYDQDSLVKAQEFFVKSIDLKEEIDDKGGLAMTYANLGNVYTKLKYYELAQDNLEKSISIRTSLDDQYGLLHSNLCLADLYLEQEEFLMAKELSLECVEVSTDLDLKVQERDAYFRLSRAEEGLKDFENSLVHHKLYTAITDSLVNEDNMRTAQQLEAELGAEEQDLVIEGLKEEVSKKKSFWEEGWFEFLIFFVVLAVFMAIVFFFLDKKTTFTDQGYYKIDQLKTLRLLFFTAALMAPVLGFYRSTSSESIFDPLWLRLCASSVILIPLIGSYRSIRIRNIFESISVQLYYVLTVFLVFLMYKNNLNTYYFIDVIIVAAAAPALFAKLKQFIYYFVFFVTMAYTAFFLCSEPAIDLAGYSISIFIAIGVIGLTFLAKLNSQRQLTLSNEIVNEVDALVLIADDSGKYIYASKSIQDILGYEREEALAEDFLSKAGFSEEEAIETRQNTAELASGEKEPRTNEFQPYRTKDGEIRWIFWKDKRIEGNRVLGIGQDVTDRKEILDELKESEKNFRFITETLSDVFYLYNINLGRYDYISPKCKDILGMSAEEFYDGESYNQNLIFPDDKEIVLDANKKVDAGFPYEIEYRIVKDGEVRWIKEKSVPIYDENGNVNRNSGTCRDITAEKLVEEDLLKLSLVTSRTTNYVIIAHAENGIEWVNDAFIKKFDYTLEDVKGKYPSDVLHQKDSKVLRLVNEIVFEKGLEFTGEIMHTTRSGEAIYSHVDIIPMNKEEGRVTKYFVLGTDLTDKKAQEKTISLAHKELKIKEVQLSQSEKMFRQLISSIEQVFWLSNYKTGELGYVSQRYEELFGVTAQSLKDDPTSWSNQIHPEDKDRIVESFQKKSSKDLFDENYRIIVDGAIKWVNSRVFTLKDEEGNIEMLSGISEDITPRMLQEIELKEISERLSVVHAIENAVLSSESKTDVIYNSLNETIRKLPILRSSLALFDYEKKSFYSYTAKEDNDASLSDKREFNLNEFGALDELEHGRKAIITDISKKPVKTETDLILIEEGVTLCLMSPLEYNGKLIGSFNVCFKSGIQEDIDHYLAITSEVASGLAIAINQADLRDLVVQKNKDITSSINYAKMIQEAFIPQSLNIGNTDLEHFIMFEPKDIVSGDFYWATEKNGKHIFVIGDCTGHGVPGAFMTIIGITSFENVVAGMDELDPGRILEEVNDSILNSLTSSRDTQLKDGMDVAVCVYDPTKSELQFSSAKRPLITIENGEIKTYDSNKISIGDDFVENKFDTTLIEVGKGQYFYLFSDGFTDQFGGHEYRKFNRKRTLELIQTIYEQDAETQKACVVDAIMKWKGDGAQTDDIIFAGFKL